MGAASTTKPLEARWECQRSFDELGRPLRDVTFCVVDLETTGGSAEAGSMITEIGAVKVRGGEVLGEFQTLVNPHTEIPPFIAVLTGITNSMVADAPPIESALPAFLEFAAGTVLVAHNAPFDVGFLRHFAERQGRAVAGVRGARHRQAGPPGDHPRRRPQLQAVLAGQGVRLLDHPQPPRPLRRTGHRRRPARADGAARRPRRRTRSRSSRRSPRGSSTAQRRKRHLAEGLPHAPGVYLFRDDAGRVLYVGTSRDLRTRVRTYFTASETRSRMGEMVGLAKTVTGHRVRHRRWRPRCASCG